MSVFINRCNGILCTALLSTGFLCSAVVTALLAGDVLSTGAQYCAAQEPLNDTEKAVIAFDFRIDKAAASRIATELDIRNEIATEMGEGRMDEHIKKINRIIGAVSAPKDAKSLQMLFMGPGAPEEMKMPIEDYDDFDDGMPNEDFGDFKPETVADPDRNDGDSRDDGRDFGGGDGDVSVSDGNPVSLTGGRYTRLDGLQESAVQDAQGKQELERVATDLFRDEFGDQDFDEMQFDEMEMDEWEPEPIPVDFFLQIQFEDAAAAKAVFDEMRRFEFENEIQIGNRTMYTSEYSPPNLRMQMFNDTTIEVGTEKFLSQPDRNLFTANLTTTWGKIGDGALRAAWDTAGCKDLINQARQMAEQEMGEMPADMAELANLVDNVASIRLNADLESVNLLELTVSATGADSAGQIQQGMNQLIGLGRMFGENNMEEIEYDNPGAAKFFNMFSELIRTEANGDEVSLLIPKPEGFDDQMITFVGEMKAVAADMNELNRFRDVVLGVHFYHDTHNSFPFESNEKFNENLSWRARMPEYIWGGLFFEYDKPWNDPTNVEFATEMPEYFGDGGELTDVCRIVSAEEPKTLMDVDNMSQTIILLQNPDRVPWTQNKDLTVDEAVALFNRLQEGETLIAAMYDGSVRRLSREIGEEAFRKMLDWKGE